MYKMAGFRPYFIFGSPNTNEITKLCEMNCRFGSIKNGVFISSEYWSTVVILQRYYCYCYCY
jgi:hypothetical protein